MSVSAAIRPVAVVTVHGVPPNWANARFGHHMARARAMAAWREAGWYAAQSARNAAHWPLALKGHPVRFLTVEIHKLRPLYDDDGAVNCLKPLVDAMTRVLVRDDSPTYLGLVTPPTEMQRVVAREADERVVLTVHLFDPRTKERDG